MDNFAELRQYEEDMCEKLRKNIIVKEKEKDIINDLILRKKARLHEIARQRQLLSNEKLRVIDELAKLEKDLHRIAPKRVFTLDDLMKTMADPSNWVQSTDFGAFCQMANCFSRHADMNAFRQHLMVFESLDGIFFGICEKCHSNFQYLGQLQHLDELEHYFDVMETIEFPVLFSANKQIYLYGN